MDEIAAIGRTGGRVRLAADAVEGFRERVRGPVHLPGEEGYEDARTLWNGMIDKRPALVVRPSGAADVADTMRFVREHDLLCAVRGGGHNIAGTAVCDGGLMIDCTPLRGVRLVPGTRRVVVQPGCVWGDVDRETLPHGLAVPSGIVSTTGVAGLTLGGGFGWLTRRHGFTCDHLVAADVITADGELVRASAEGHPDLLWGLKGGGGNFGIVTAFEFEAVPFGPEAFCGLAVFAYERLDAVIAAFRDLTDRAPEELTSLLLVRIAPPAPFLPEALHGRAIAAIGICYDGPPEAGEAAIAPVRALGEPAADLIGVKPLVRHQAMLDAAQPHGRRYHWQSHYLPALDDAVATAIHRHTAALPSPHSAMLFTQLGGAAARVSATESPAGNRAAPFLINIAGAWDDPATDAPGKEWTRGFHADLAEHATGGVYVNFLTQDEGADRTRAAYDPATFDRLVELKRRYDPENVFRLNRNIPP